MKLAGKEIPCGCDDRKEIMFTQGGFTATHVLVLVAVGVAVYVIGRKLT